MSRLVATDNKTLANESNKLVVPISIEVASTNALIGESTQVFSKEFSNLCSK